MCHPSEDLSHFLDGDVAGNTTDDDDFQYRYFYVEFKDTAKYFYCFESKFWRLGFVCVGILLLKIQYTLFYINLTFPTFFLTYVLSIVQFILLSQI